MLTSSGHEANREVKFTCCASELSTDACCCVVPMTTGAGIDPGLTAAMLPTAGNQQLPHYSSHLTRF